MPLAKDDAATATDETSEVESTGTEPGFHVYLKGKHNSGPYESEEDAQCFIDQQLEGKGNIKEAKASE